MYEIPNKRKVDPALQGRHAWQSKTPPRMENQRGGGFWGATLGFETRGSRIRDGAIADNRKSVILMRDS